MMSTIMKWLLCTFFVVLTYTTFTGANTHRSAALLEIINNAGKLKKIGQDTWGPLLTPVNIELNCSVHHFKEGLKSLKLKCVEIAGQQNNCRRYIQIISRNMKNVKHYPECKYEEKSFTDFMSQLISFSQKKYKENNAKVHNVQ